MAEMAEGEAPGWHAIDAALKAIYHDRVPKHYGTILNYRIGGQDPLDGISVYSREDPIPHWHFITYGFTELYGKELRDLEINGFGFELTFRLRRGAEVEPPAWVLNFLQNLARYVFKSVNAFNVGHHLDCNGPIALESNTALCALLFAPDPELTEIVSSLGRARFIQIVGLTADELFATKRWSSTRFTEVLRTQLPFLCTDLSRSSILAQPAIREKIERGVAEEGSSTAVLYVTRLAWTTKRPILGAKKVTVYLGAHGAEEIAKILSGRLPHGRSLAIIGERVVLELAPDEHCSFVVEDSTLKLTLTPEAVTQLVENLRPIAQTVRLTAFPSVEIVIEKTKITDQSGNVVKVIG